MKTEPESSMVDAVFAVLIVLAVASLLAALWSDLLEDLFMAALRMVLGRR